MKRGEAARCVRCGVVISTGVLCRVCAEALGAAKWVGPWYAACALTRRSSTNE